jgi:hypothetical protein
MDRTLRTAAGPPPLYYLAIDGTDAKDAATFGALLESRGWKNLATTFLRPAPDDPNRLVDPTHDFLPIPLIPARGKKIAVVAPCGTNGLGLEPFWARYQGTVDSPRGRAVGRYAAAELGAKLTKHLILEPAVQTNALDPGTPCRGFADPELTSGTTRPVVARLLYVSTHGFLSGSMAASALHESAPPWPESTRQAYALTTAYFVLGAAANSGKGFHGPEWIVLAQCSTLSMTSWPLWSRILGRSSPGVRGILAYEDAAPKPQSAVGIAEAFFRELDQGATFIDGWRRANHGVRWAALVHEDARADTLSDFPRFRTLTKVGTTRNSGTYRGYLQSTDPAGEPVRDVPPPFGFKLEHRGRASRDEVTPENLGSIVSEFVEGDRYCFTIAPPADSAATKIEVTAIHIRASLTNEQFSWNSLFSFDRVASNLILSGANTPTLSVTQEVAVDVPALVFWATAKAPAAIGLLPSHSYIWFRIKVCTPSGVLQHDFKHQGLTY